MTSGAPPGAPEAGPLSSREGIARRFTIAVHAGAGSISAASESSRIAAVKAALLAARNVLFEEGGCALTACVAAVVSMEDDPLCNAGFGSSLTEDATVECDAAVMDGAVLTYGACAATPNVRNPVRLAARLLERQLGPARALGRVHPMLLAGTGAWRWAKAEGLAVFETGDDQLTSDRARQTFARYTAQVREEEAAESTCSRAEGGVAASRKRPRCAGAQDNDSISATNDTVGAVVCDGMHVASAVPRAARLRTRALPQLHSQYHTSCVLSMGVSYECGLPCNCLGAQVSSGGIWLKHSGRVGSAAMFGAGCWARDATELEAERHDPGGADAEGQTRSLPPEPVSVGASISGVGEEVMQKLLARQLCCALGRDGVPAQVAAELLCEGSGTSTSRSADACQDGVAAGMLALRCSRSTGVECIIAHSTPAFAIGMLSDAHATPTAMVSRCEAGRTHRVLSMSM